MNIFVTSPCPRECARNLDDKRVGKLLMEANQMLSLAIKHSRPDWQDHVGPGMLVKGFAYNNHPCSIWVRESPNNFWWLLRHAQELGHEFEFRFGYAHASFHRTLYIGLLKIDYPIDLGNPKSFVNCASNQSLNVSFKHIEDVPKAYQEYLKFRWANDKLPVNFTNREAPSWKK
jgi:hypothetical protein